MTTLTTRLSSKGQVIIPKEIRDRQGWGAGTVLVVAADGGVVTLRPAEEEFPATTVDQLAGMLKHDGPPKTIEEMDEGILRAIKEEWR